METTVELQSELIPDPTTVVALVAQLVEGKWPSSDAERETLFRRLRFKSGERLNQDSNRQSTAAFVLLTNLPGISFASWDSLHNRFLGVHFHLYSFPDAHAPATRRGHDTVSGKLTNLYGKSTRPWEDEEAPPSIWKVNNREIVTHLFTMRDSTLLLSISDQELATAAEAEAVHRTRASSSINPSP